jgi:hypothetical protein
MVCFLRYFNYPPKVFPTTLIYSFNKHLLMLTYEPSTDGKLRTNISIFCVLNGSV